MPTEKIFLFEALDLISSTTIAGTLYGIIFTLYCLCARSLYLQLQNPEKRHHATLTLAYSSILFLCGTCDLATNTRLIQLAYVNHANSPGGPLIYETSSNPTSDAYRLVDGVFQTIIVVLTMIIQLRRLWIVWSGTRYVVAVAILPVLLLLSYIALVIPINILPQDIFSNRITIAMGVATFAIMAAFTFLVTGLIAVRLLLARKQHMRIMGTSEAASPYLSIVAMLVESYILDSAWSLATAILIIARSPGQVVFQENDSIIKLVAYFLVIYRVENGRGWTKETEKKLTTLQWNHDTHTPPDDEVSGIRFGGPVTAPVMEIKSLPVTHPYSAV